MDLLRKKKGVEVRTWNRGALAAAAMGTLSLTAIGLGVLLITQLGGSSGQDLGRGAGQGAWAKVLPILFAAEIVKLVTAGAQIVLVSSMLGHNGRPQRAALVATGFAGALLIAASGLVGFYAIANQQPELTAQTSLLGFIGLTAGAVWVLLVIALRPLTLDRWHMMVGLLFAITSIAALFWAPFAMLSVLPGVIWWFGLAARLKGAVGRSSDGRQELQGATPA